MQDIEDCTVAEVREGIKALRDAPVQTVGDVIERLGTASFAPLLIVISLIVVTPISAVPGLTTIAGLTIAAVATQLLLGRRSIWLPAFILRRPVSRSMLRNSIDQMDKPLKTLEHSAERRLTALTRGIAVQMLLITCILCGLSMPFLELVPATSSLLALTVLLLMIGIVTRDGLFALGGLAFLAITVSVLFVLFRSLFGLF